ncbi:carbohydrate ABC transporter permease [Treponema sp. OttesenSCG-928-L16]|nr:carbohydrate ABC transporter permease [Treponema sp. OttesenSCG-928-L16]
MLKTKNITTLLLYAILCVIGLVCLFPYAWLFSASFKPEAKIFVIPPKLIPDPFTLANYKYIFQFSPIVQWMINSIKITLIVIAFGSLVASMAGFAYSKLRFPGANFLFILPLTAMMIPNEVIIVPLFRVWSALGFINTHVPLITPNIVGVGGMFGVFLFRQFYLSVPGELCEAARIDGCTPFGIFFRIMLPLSISPLATLAIFNFMQTWNDFLDPLIYLNSPEKYTVSLGLNLYQDIEGKNWGAVMAACVFSTLPLIIMFFSLQKKFIESVALSGMKS